MYVLCLVFAAFCTTQQNKNKPNNQLKISLSLKKSRLLTKIILSSLLLTPSDQVFRITPSDEKKVHMLKKILGNMKVGLFCLSFLSMRVCSKVSDSRSSGVWLSVTVRTLPVWMIVFLALCFLSSV